MRNILFFALFQSTQLLASDFLDLEHFDRTGLKSQQVTVLDPNESTDQKNAQIKFDAYPGLEFLDKVFGSRDAWAKSKELVFKCSDGYQPALETKFFQKKGFYFAFARVGQKDFTIVNNFKDGKVANLSPFYLIWTDPTKQKKGTAYFWPYQLVRIKAQEAGKI